MKKKARIQGRVNLQKKHVKKNDNLEFLLQTQQNLTELCQLLSTGPDVQVGLVPVVVEKYTGDGIKV